MPSSRPYCDYRRLSADREGKKLGYEVQGDGTEGWAKAAGEVMGERYKDSNLTAADEDVWRPDYERMLEDVAKGLYAGILIYRCDRLTRLSGQFERCLKAARDGNALIISVDENLRSDREDQLTMMKLKVLMGEAEVRGMKIRTRANASVRRKKGIYQGGGRRPYGFEAPLREAPKRDGEDEDEGKGELTNSGRIGVVHVPEEVKNLREAAARVIAGESYTEIIYDWHSRTPPVYGAYGAPWNPRKLEDILTSPRMIGQQMYKTTNPETGETASEPVKAKWEPVLDRAEWERLVARRRVRAPYGPKTKHLLSGLAVCGRCGQPLGGSIRRFKKGEKSYETRIYRCNAMPEAKARGACGKLSVTAEPVERLVLDFVFLRIIEAREVPAAVNDETELHRQIDQAGIELERCEAELEELRLAKEDRANRMSLSEYLRLKKPILEDQDQAKASIKSLTQRVAIPRPVGRDFDDLDGWFEDLSLTQQRKLLGAHLTGVRILPTGRAGGRFFNPERVVPLFADPKKADG